MTAKKQKTIESPIDADALSYKLVPELAAYIDRINASQLNFRRFMIREQRGAYYIERSLIKISGDGDVTCSRAEHRPTKEEAAAIKAAVAREKWPRAVGATAAATMKHCASLSGQSFQFWDLGRRAVVMVQERIETAEGKAYVPWTFFSDGRWRRMEPDGALPFWKPEPFGKGKRELSRIMIHEGAKGASFVDALVRDPERVRSHPWGEELAEYRHWGIIGGALAPHRADYSELREAKPREVVYVCDNDWEGGASLQEVSRCYGGRLKGIRFDKRWPPSWDMADEVPKNLYKGTRFTGPSLARLVVPATHATELVAPEGGRGRPMAVMRRAFKEEWFHSVTPEAFVHADWPNAIRTAKEFNNFVRPFSDVDDTARLMQMDAASKSADLQYDPSRPSGIYSAGDAGRFMNTYCPSAIKPERGDVRPWLDFMEQLVPDETDRTELTRWVATLVARPAVKMNYGVLLVSETQGVGKGTLGEKILTPLVGPWNVSTPSEHDVCDTNYNYWIAHKRLAVVHEIYAGHSSKAYDKLKSAITEAGVTVHKKYMADYDIGNWIHIFANSNSMRAIKLDIGDRRWLIPKITEEKRPAAYWERLNSWLTDDGGLEAIAWWCDDWVKRNQAVDRSSNAPWSRQKSEMIEEGYSPGMKLVRDFLTNVKGRMEDEAWVVANTRPDGANGEWTSPGIVIVDMALVEMVTQHVYRGSRSNMLERPLTLRKMAKAVGWHVHPDQYAVAGATHGRLLCSRQEMVETPIGDLLARTRKLDVRVLAEGWFPLL